MADETTAQDRRVEFLEQYEQQGVEPCGQCEGHYFEEPTGDCPSFEHQAVYQTWCAHYWREQAERLNPTHHLRREVLEEPVFVFEEPEEPVSARILELAQ